ncbi:hypothetical protein AMET1_1084 [Methanonatronarchaeum thermophilum]|uniref:DUF424 domain-containing protein n=1 Tax=Methanonatronarchaeum thermophilum TaxID=1927129 RepID=A0A1Y3GAA6_9EURY|nr:DUF424 family protein [Methanonatronarchaeum thermophilum]OUJ18180.1 hypothetical protein AMET1_1084 [Methanonatronarchaeum thermophilum]
MKTHVRRAETIVAVCDEDLVGKELAEEGRKISIRESFYGSESRSKKDIKEALNNATIGNLIGRNSVDLGIEVGVIDEENVMDVCGVPHAQVVVMDY